MSGKKFNPLTFLGILLIVSLLTISVGFAALSTTLTINGAASFTPVGMIRVLSINQDNLNGALESSKSYTADTISVSLDFNDLNGSATYNVNITNLGQTDKALSNVINEVFSNNEIEYELIGLEIGRLIKAKESVDFKVKFKYRADITTPLSSNLNATIKFVFEDYQETTYIAYFKPYDGTDGLFGFDKTSITSFKRNTTLSLSDVLNKPGVELISNSSDDQYDSKKDVYGWVENGVFYWWSDALIAYFHPNTLKAFSKFSNIVTIDLTDTSTEKVQNFSHWFDTDTKLKTITGKIDTSGLKLEYNTGFNYANDTNNDTSSGVGFAYMFNDCYVLESIDLSLFNTKNATDMKRMFAGCRKITTLDVSSFDTSNVKSMYWMFRRNYALTEIDLTGFNTSNVENMFGMFVEDSKLTNVKLGDNFNTSKVKNFGNMFYGTSRLAVIYAKMDFVRNSGSISGNMFNNTDSLVGSKGTDYEFKFNSSYKDSTYAQLATATQNGYFTPYTQEEIKYTITYVLDGGVTDNPFYYKPNSTITLNEPVKTGYDFVGWTGSNGDVPQKSVTITSDMTGNLTYYANWSLIEIPTIKFEFAGPCILNGKTANITGDACSIYSDVKFINSHITLFDSENYSKDFDISFDLSDYVTANQEANQVTVLNSLAEKHATGNPGFVIRRSSNQLQVLVRNDKGTTKTSNVNITDNMNFKIVRRNNKICYNVNNTGYVFAANFEGFTDYFDTEVYFGASADGSGNPWRQIKGTLSNMSIKVGSGVDNTISCG